MQLETWLIAVLMSAPTILPMEREEEISAQQIQMQQQTKIQQMIHDQEIENNELADGYESDDNLNLSEYVSPTLLALGTLIIIGYYVLN